MKIVLTNKQHATLKVLKKETDWLSSSQLGRQIYDLDPDNYQGTIESLGFSAFAKIGTDRTRELLKGGLVERKFIGYLGYYKYRITERGLAALEGRTI